jgi:hypothetical protein
VKSLMKKMLMMNCLLLTSGKVVEVVELIIKQGVTKSKVVEV